MSDDRGSAVVEFTYLGVLLLVPLVYVMLTVFSVQKAAFGVTEAARAAGRAYATAGSDEAGRERAAFATRLALADQGLEPEAPPRLVCEAVPCLSPGAAVTVSVTYRVPLPLVGDLFGVVPGSIPVTGRHVAVVDRFRAPS